MEMKHHEIILEAAFKIDLELDLREVMFPLLSSTNVRLTTLKTEKKWKIVRLCPDHETLLSRDFHQESVGRHTEICVERRSF